MKEMCFYCEPTVRSNCENMTGLFQEDVCKNIIKPKEKTTFWLGCPVHGTVATDMLLTDLSVVYDAHREVCEEYLTILPQCAKKL